MRRAPARMRSSAPAHCPRITYRHSTGIRPALVTASALALDLPLVTAGPRTRANGAVELVW